MQSNARQITGAPHYHHYSTTFSHYAADDAAVKHLVEFPVPKEEAMEPGMVYKMATGQLPDLRNLCHEISGIIAQMGLNASVRPLVPVLNRMNSLEPGEVKSLLKHKETRHVLVSSERFDLVLNLWKPGKASDVHGHNGTRCFFKLLNGRLEELRYSPDKKSRLLSMDSLRSGDMAYIDDSIAHHQVGNPYGSPAISIHIYLK